MSTPADNSKEAAVVVSFKLRQNASVENFLNLSCELEKWLRNRPGFRRYELFRSRDGWSDTMVWSDRATAIAGNKLFLTTDLAAAMTGLVEPDYQSFIGERVILHSESANA